MPQPGRFEKKSQDFRQQEKRPYRDQRPQSPGIAQTPQAIDPVEKSLRDINMRLKHAERDQEFARKKIQENFPRGDHRNRDDRDRGGNRDRNRDHQRNPRRDNWQDRNRYDSSQPQQPAPVAAQSLQVQEPAFEKAPQIPAPVPQPAIERPMVSAATGPTTLVPSDFSSEDSLQHGRKIVVKRRVLKDELPEGAKIAETAGSSAGIAETPAESPAEETTIDQGAPGTPETEIRFGRR